MTALPTVPGIDLVAIGLVVLVGSVGVTGLRLSAVAARRHRAARTAELLKRPRGDG